MAQIVNGQVQYASGEALPAVGTPEYNLAKSDPQSLLNFKAANPNLTFGSEDMTAYNNAGSQVITPKGLASATPYKLPEPTPQTTGPAISGAADASLTQTDQQRALDAKVAVDTQAKDKSKTDMQSLQDQILGVQSSRGDVENGLQLTEKNQMANDAYSALQASKRAQEKELKALTDTGGSEAGISRAQGDINRKYAFEQADLSIALDVANRNLTAAQSTADRKIQLQLEPLLTKLDFQKTFYQDNKDQLTKDEDRQYQSLLTKSQRDYDTTKNNANSIQDWISKAISAKQPQLISEFSKLDPNSKTFTQDLAKVSSKLGFTDATSAPKVEKINGVDVQWNPKTGQWETPSVKQTTSQPTLQLAQAQGNVQSISDLATNSAIAGAVGPNIFARSGGGGLDQLTGAKQNFIASVEQVRSNLNLDALIGAKARGATFGALSDQELQVLASSASKIGSWAIKDGSGNVVGYNANEKDFKKELDKINNFAKLDFIIKGGDPMDVNAQLMPDGSVWTTNSDGTYTQIK